MPQFFHTGLEQQSTVLLQMFVCYDVLVRLFATLVKVLLKDGNLFSVRFATLSDQVMERNILEKQPPSYPVIGREHGPRRVFKLVNPTNFLFDGIVMADLILFGLFACLGRVISHSLFSSPLVIALFLSWLEMLSF